MRLKEWHDLKNYAGNDYICGTYSELAFLFLLKILTKRSFYDTNMSFIMIYSLINTNSDSSVLYLQHAVHIFTRASKTLLYIQRHSSTSKFDT